MQRVIANIPMDCEIIFTSCTHIGSHLCHYKGINDMVKFVKAKPNRRLIHLGDLVEAITSDDKRYSSSVKEPIPMKQIQEATEIFRPIKDQMLCVLGGNHELKLHRFGNLAELFANNLGIPYGTRTARVIFMGGENILFRAFITHDVPAFRSNAKDFLQRQANILAAMKVTLQHRMGDTAIMICGHAHQLLTIQPSQILYITDGEDSVKQHYLSGDQGDGGFINPDQRWYGCAGSFRKKYKDGIDDYGESFQPVELGYLILTVSNGKIVSLEKKVV